MQNIVMLTVIYDLMLSVASKLYTLSVIMLNVVVLSVVMLNVMVPLVEALQMLSYVRAKIESDLAAFLFFILLNLK